MGCGASMPKAEEVLRHRAARPEAYLMDGVPSSVTMQSWSYINTSGKYHNETNPVLQAIQFGQMIKMRWRTGTSTRT